MSPSEPTTLPRHMIVRGFRNQIQVALRTAAGVAAVKESLAEQNGFTSSANISCSTISVFSIAFKVYFEVPEAPRTPGAYEHICQDHVGRYCLQVEDRRVPCATYTSTYCICFGHVSSPHHTYLPLATVGIYKVTNVDVGDDERCLARTW